MGKVFIISLCSILAFILVFSLIFFNLTEAGIKIWNTWTGNLQKADDDTNYETLKQVEGTCRMMIASYKKDKLTYLQYKGSEDEMERMWANEAKMRANNTVATYNEYILKNRYVWKNDIPSDIDYALEFIID